MESHRFASKYMQRDVEVEFETVDKAGGMCLILCYVLTFSWAKLVVLG